MASMWSSPMSFVFLGTSLRSRVTILMASRRISMTLLMRANRGASGKAATNMVVKLNWITKERAKINLSSQKPVPCFSRAWFLAVGALGTARRAAYPSPGTHWTDWRSLHRWAGSCWASFEACSFRIAPIHVWPPIRLSGSSGHISSAACWSFVSSAICRASWCKHQMESEYSGSHSAHVITNLLCTYGTVNSKTLLMVCFSTIMIAIWMNRSVRHPLGWHCREESERIGTQSGEELWLQGTISLLKSMSCNSTDRVRCFWMNRFISTPNRLKTLLRVSGNIKYIPIVTV